MLLLSAVDYSLVVHSSVPQTCLSLCFLRCLLKAKLLRHHPDTQTCFIRLPWERPGGAPRHALVSDVLHEFQVWVCIWYLCSNLDRENRLHSCRPFSWSFLNMCGISLHSKDRRGLLAAEKHGVVCVTWHARHSFFLLALYAPNNLLGIIYVPTWWTCSQSWTP